MIEELGKLLSSWSVFNCGCPTTNQAVTFLIFLGIFIIGSIIFVYDSDNDLSYYDHWERRKYYKFTSRFIIFIINVFYFTTILLISNIFGLFGMIIGSILYCIIHYLVTQDNTDSSLFGISRSIDEYFSILNKFNSNKNTFRLGYLNVKDYYKNFMKVENIKVK